MIHEIFNSGQALHHIDELLSLGYCEINNSDSNIIKDDLTAFKYGDTINNQLFININDMDKTFCFYTINSI